MTLKPRGGLKSRGIQRKPRGTRLQAPKRLVRKSKPKKRGKILSVSKLMKLADSLCSRFVRLSGIDSEGYATCYTCGHRAHYKKLHTGHFVSRFVKITRYALDNLRIQCPMCNLWKRGDILTFRENLIKEIGEDKVLWLEKQRKQPFKPTRQFYEGIIEVYRDKLARLDLTKLQ